MLLHSAHGFHDTKRGRSVIPYSMNISCIDFILIRSGLGPCVDVLQSLSNRLDHRGLVARIISRANRKEDLGCHSPNSVFLLTSSTCMKPSAATRLRTPNSIIPPPLVSQSGDALIDSRISISIPAPL